jgi:hypothetical protein
MVHVLLPVDRRLGAIAMIAMLRRKVGSERRAWSTTEMRWREASDPCGECAGEEPRSDAISNLVRRPARNALVTAA